MEQKEKEVFDNKEDFLKNKEKVLKKVGLLLDQGGPFLIMGETGKEGVLAIGGSPDSIAEVVAKMRARVDELDAIIELSNEALEYGKERANERGKFADVNGNNPVSDMIDKLGCETCPTKSECEIYKLASEKFDQETILKFLKALAQKHPHMLGSMMQMSKGGDA